MLVGAVVIAGDGTGADIDITSDRAVADIGQMIGLGAGANIAVLDLGEVANVHALRQLAARANARIRPEPAIGADDRVLEMAEGLDARPGGNAHVFQHALGPDGDAIAQRDIALEHAVDVYGHIAAEGEPAAHVNARGVGQRDTLLHQHVGHFELVDALELRQLRLAVDAGGLPVDVRAGRPDRDPGLHRRGNHIGEVILFLRVVVLERGQPGLEPRRGQHHDASVDLANFQLLVGGVLVLDDARHLAAAPDDAAVAIGVIKLHGEQPDALAGRPDQPLQGHRPDQRHIAIEHQRRRRVIEQRHRLHHRVAGAKLRLLPDPGHISIGGKGLAHALPAMAVDDNNARRLERTRRGDDMRQQRHAGKLVQHLGKVGVHALALAGGEDDDIHDLCVRVNLGRGANVSTAEGKYPRSAVAAAARGGYITDSRSARGRLCQGGEK